MSANTDKLEQAIKDLQGASAECITCKAELEAASQKFNSAIAAVQTAKAAFDEAQKAVQQEAYDTTL